MSSINDYPEHLNPFYEDDNHNRIRFWTKTKKLVRSNSFSLSGFNDGFKGLRNSIRRSVSRSRRNSTTTSKESSPVMLRRQLSPQDNYSPEYGYTTERIKNEYGFVVPYEEQHKYLYKNSITPTPKTKHSSLGGGSEEYFSLPIRSSRYRFQPDATSTPRKATSVCDHRTSQQPFALPGLASSTMSSTSRKTSICSLNPFEENGDSEFDGSNLSPASIRTSKNGTLRRKKRRAPLPPSINQSLNDSGIQVLDVTDPVFNTSLEITENDLTSAQKSMIEEKNTAPTNNSEEIEIISSQIEKLCNDTLNDVVKEDINGNSQIIVENKVQINEQSIENQSKIEKKVSVTKKSKEINGNGELNTDGSKIDIRETEEIEKIVENSTDNEKSGKINENELNTDQSQINIEETSIVENSIIQSVEINRNELKGDENQTNIEETYNYKHTVENTFVNKKPLEINENEPAVENKITYDENLQSKKIIDNQIDSVNVKIVENELENTENSNNADDDETKIDNSSSIIIENGLTKIESKVDKYIDDSNVITTPQCPVKIIISTHDDQASPKLSVKDMVRNLDERSRKESMKNEEKLFIDEKHLAKEEVFIDDTETNNNFENNTPKPVPRVKKSGTTTAANGDHKIIDPTKPNPIPKPKRSKLFAKLTNWTHKN